ncbi:MAG: AAA family ATPase [Chloroflexi bacterium]|nr:AAA family ATPase [Chloroflexota bacterium]
MWQVIGQGRAVSFLQCSLEKGAVAHAYLFAGLPHVGKMTLALNLAQALNCEQANPPCGQCDACQKIASARHADVQVIGLAQDDNTARTRTEVSIDQVRQLQHAASLPPFEGRCKVFIIDGAEQLSIEAANCLLKTLEEPADRVVFILLTSDERLLPATVVSRCQRLELLPLAPGEAEAALVRGWGVEPQKARLLARLCRGCLGQAVSAIGENGWLGQRAEIMGGLLDIIDADYEKRFTHAARLATRFSQDRGSVHEVLEMWLGYWRDLLLVKAGCAGAITNLDLESRLTDMAGHYRISQIKDVVASILAAGEQLKQNANPQLVLEVLMLSIPRKEERVRKGLPA